MAKRPVWILYVPLIGTLIYFLSNREFFYAALLYVSVSGLTHLVLHSEAVSLKFRVFAALFWPLGWFVAPEVVDYDFLEAWPQTTVVQLIRHYEYSGIAWNLHSKLMLVYSLGDLIPLTASIEDEVIAELKDYYLYIAVRYDGSDVFRIIHAEGPDFFVGQKLRKGVQIYVYK